MRLKLALFSLPIISLLTQSVYAVYIFERDDSFQDEEKHKTIKSRTIGVSFDRNKPTSPDFTKIVHVKTPTKKSENESLANELYTRVQTSCLIDKIPQDNLSVTFSNIKTSKHIDITGEVTSKLLKSFSSSSSLSKTKTISIGAVAFGDASTDIETRTNALDEYIRNYQDKAEEKAWDYAIEDYNSSENYPDSE